jgi:hypothetical protein
LTTHQLSGDTTLFAGKIQVDKVFAIFVQTWFAAINFFGKKGEKVVGMHFYFLMKVFLSAAAPLKNLFLINSYFWKVFFTKSLPSKPKRRKLSFVTAFQNTNRFFRWTEIISKVHVTKCYKMLQDVTKCYKNVTKCYKMLQNVTKCYKMLQNVTKCY